MTVRQAVPVAVGLTQASSVMPVVRCSDAESGIATKALVPLKFSAPPNLPVVVCVALVIVPVFALPDASATVVPDASLKLHAPTRLAEAGGVTFSVTAIVFGEPVAPCVVAVTLTLPVYVPTARPLTFVPIDSVAGAVALAGVTLSHGWSEVAVTSRLPVPVFVTDAFWLAGLGPPCVALNVMVAGETDNTGGGGAATVSVTAIVCGEPVIAPPSIVTLAV